LTHLNEHLGQNVSLGRLISKLGVLEPSPLRQGRGKKMSHQRSPGIATKDDLNDFFDVGDDKRNEILRARGLSVQRDHDWSTIWSVLGLGAEQKRKIWDDLRVPLLDVAEVADIIGKRPKTVSGWCREGMYPCGFPVPFDFGPRTKRWIELEILAYQKPKLYGKDARKIVRLSRSSRKVLQRPVENGPLPTTLDPMVLT
jgi:predicted DNA-binding transcriptional regulator AlpA